MLSRLCNLNKPQYKMFSIVFSGTRLPRPYWQFGFTSLSGEEPLDEAVKKIAGR